MVYKLGVNIVRDFLHDKKREFDDLFRLKRWKGTKNFCRAIRHELDAICRKFKINSPRTRKQGILQQ